LKPDGTLKWKYEIEGLVYSSPAIGSDGTIYFGSTDNYVYALNSDGTLRWKFETGAEIYCSPTIGMDGTIYIASNDGYLYAISGSGTLANSPWPKFQHDLRNTGNVVTTNK